MAALSIPDRLLPLADYLCKDFPNLDFYLDKIGPETQLYGIIGNPVKHSFSPAMHTAGFEAIGLDAVYLPFQPELEQLPEILDLFQQVGVKGFNVTVPFKEAIIPVIGTRYTNEATNRLARILQSVNTVVRTERGWTGHTTDGNGFVRSLEEKGWPIEDGSILILGAGGSAKSIAGALLEKEPEILAIQNRTQAKTDELLQTLETYWEDEAEFFGSDEPQTHYDLLINTTSLGMTSDDSPADLDLIRRADRVADIIYNPPETRLLKAAKAEGKPTMNGLGMLLYQGVEAFELWTNHKAPVEVMKKSLCQTLGIAEELF